MATHTDVTRMLEDGDAEGLLPLLHARLDAAIRVALIAGRPLRPHRLVHETWLALLADGEDRWRHRSTLLSLAARPVLRLLVHHARAAHEQGRQLQVELSGWPSREACVPVLELDAALVRIRLGDTRRSRLIELRDLAGLAVHEAAEVLAVSHETVRREWTWARTGLLRDLGVLPAPPRPDTDRGAAAGVLSGL